MKPYIITGNLVINGADDLIIYAGLDENGVIDDASIADYIAKHFNIGYNLSDYSRDVGRVRITVERLDAE